MPECDGKHLLAYLIEMGVTGGDYPLSFAEIESWQHGTGVELEAWEVGIVRKLSEAYMSESSRARKPDAPAPWQDAPYIRPAPNQVAIQVQRAIQKLANL